MYDTEKQDQLQLYNGCFHLLCQMLRASAHGWCFAAAADYFLAVRTDGERNATFSHFLHDLVQSVCARGICCVTTCFTTIP